MIPYIHATDLQIMTSFKLNKQKDKYSNYRCEVKKANIHIYEYYKLHNTLTNS